LPRRSGWFTIVVWLALVLCAALLDGCGGGGIPEGAVVGRAGRWDYTPSVIQTGQVQQFWWCGEAPNPAKPSQDTDTILYESIDLTTGQHFGPQVALAETPGGWDSAYTCNPKVIRGKFSNPLGDGQAYTYALYYVGTSNVAGTENSIGVAFSNDGVQWKKYPVPVIPTTNHNGYGAAQPVPYNTDGKQAITLFYEDDAPPYPVNHHWEATSTDGLHFTNTGLFTSNGLTFAADRPSWADMVFNPSDGYWYAIFNIATRNVDTTDGEREYGQWGFQLYRIPKNDLLVGTIGWQELKTFDTNLTNHESNFLPGILQDGYGNLYQDSSKNIQIFHSFSNAPVPWDAHPGDSARAARLTSWDIGQVSWSPSESTYTLSSYINGSSHVVTTGYFDSEHFVFEKSLGHVYSRPMDGATLGIYSCKRGDNDHFVSTSLNCDGSYMVGLNGYIYAQPPAGVTTVPIYRCVQDGDHFLSSDSLCEGGQTETMLGYILP